jgi:large subunit ribosomal protein L22
MSPQKLRDVSFLAIKMQPGEAIEKLPFVRRRATEPLIKVITSAIANAKQKGVEVEKLVFKEIQINEGPHLKRFRAGARGRAKPYKKRMSHIRVVLTTLNDQIPNSKSQRNSKIKDSTEEKKISKEIKNKGTEK